MIPFHFNNTRPRPDPARFPIDYWISFTLLMVLGLAAPTCRVQNRLIGWLHFDRFEASFDIVSKGDIAMVHNKGRDNAPALPAAFAARRLSEAKPRSPSWPAPS
jgi:hypothetical protein